MLKSDFCVGLTGLVCRKRRLEIPSDVTALIDAWISKTTTWKRTEMFLYHQRQKCSPKTQWRSDGGAGVRAAPGGTC